MAAWEDAGFHEVDEIVPGRLYEVRVPIRWFRIAVTRSITASVTPWNSVIDELVDFHTDVEGRRERVGVWTNVLGSSDRHLGNDAESALREAMHWLSEYAGVDAESRARGLAEDEARRHPGLHLVAASLRQRFGAVITWEDKDVARVPMGGLNFVVSLVGNTIEIKWHSSSGGTAKGKQDSVMSNDVMSPEFAGYIVDDMHRLVEAESALRSARSRERKA
jgi:hypothetical protein